VVAGAGAMLAAGLKLRAAAGNMQAT